VNAGNGDVRWRAGVEGASPQPAPLRRDLRRLCARRRQTGPRLALRAATAGWTSTLQLSELRQLAQNALVRTGHRGVTFVHHARSVHRSEDAELLGLCVTALSDA
jgi:hypothetical protein